MFRDSHFEANGELGRHEVLLQLTDLVVHHRELGELLPRVAEVLQQAVALEFLVFSLYDPTKKLMRVHALEANQAALRQMEVPLEQLPEAVVWEEQKALLVSDTQSADHFPPAAGLLKQKGIRSYYALPLTTGEKRFGILSFGSSQAQAYGDGETRFLGGVAKLVALAVEGALNRGAFTQERQRLETLLEISTTLLSHLKVQELFPAIAECIHKAVQHDFASIAIYEESARHLRLYNLTPPPDEYAAGPDTTVAVADAPFGQAFLHGTTELHDRADLLTGRMSSFPQLRDTGIQSLCFLPLITNTGTLGTLNLGSLHENAFIPKDISFLHQVAAQIAMAVDNSEAYHQVAQLTARLKGEKLHLEEEIRSILGFEEIVGDSPALKKVLADVHTVAPGDTTVLILGETGTGKELIARAIHRMSSRKDAGFLKLNCAAIPTGLLESELFGHERGAFTGALSQKLGRLELADEGTLFLDEVGEIPLELQPKLLRVLQDQEFERLGGTRTIKVNLRLIAATNRDLAKSVAAHEFRSDLYYRLHVFPLHMPPLRERGKDIPLLVRYFVQKFARRMNKQIDNISSEAMNALMRWHWPGNVRELENFIERSVILSEGTSLSVPLAELRPLHPASQNGSTLEDMEREHILRVLRETGGVVAGLRGAAARLGMKRTTLQSRMQKMGIGRADYEN